MQCSHLSAHGESQSEHEDAEADSEESPVLEQGLGPVVNDPGHQGLHVAELGIDSENLEEKKREKDETYANLKGINSFLFLYQQHDEENDCPQHGSREIEDQVRIREEDQSGSGVDHFVDGGLLDVGHVAQDREDQDSGGQTCESVDNAGDYGIPGERNQAVIFEIISG